MAILEKIKGAFRRVAADTKIGKEYKSIFQLGVPSFQQFYNNGIFIWKKLYKGYYAPWHLIPCPSIEKPNDRRNMYRLDLPKAITAELAGLIWSEQCCISVTRDGWEPTEQEPVDTLGEYVRRVLDKNGFSNKMQELIEQEQALGGAAIKVWGIPAVDGRPASVKIGYCHADQFIPTDWDNAGVKAGIFVERKAKDGFYYTRLERHTWENGAYVIYNELFRSDKKAEDNQDILGFRYPLSAMYPELEERVEINGLKRPLFVYFRPPVANNLDDNSPLGISAYANALDELRAIDECYDSFVREFRLGKKRIIVPAQSIRTVLDQKTGEMRRYFDSSDEVYEALNIEDPSTLKITDTSASLRVDEHVKALNTHLSILCLQTGLSTATFTFEAHGGLKTATEVISENSKTYKTVKTNQLIIGNALKQLVDIIIDVATLYDVEADGKRVSDLVAGGYNSAVTFDDSIVQDRQTNINEGTLLIGAGVLSKKTFMMKTLGMTEEQADAELERIAAESRIGVDDILNFDINSEG